MEKIKIEHTEVFGFESAIRGMRNPMDSWHLSDSSYDMIWDLAQTSKARWEYYRLGEKDLDLATRLIKGGSEHCKFLRQIQVWCDITLPRYVWSELDTYKFNTKNSCSTMHKLFTKKEITLDDFYYETDFERDCLHTPLIQLNYLREVYLETKDYDFVRSGKRILPESFLQKRTWNTNYQELLNIYFQRKNHRLTNEWKAVCDWIESLPYMAEFIEACESRKRG